MFIARKPGKLHSVGVLCKFCVGSLGWFTPAVPRSISWRRAGVNHTSRLVLCWVSFFLSACILNRQRRSGVKNLASGCVVRPDLIFSTEPPTLEPSFV